MRTSPRWPEGGQAWPQLRRRAELWLLACVALFVMGFLGAAALTGDSTAWHHVLRLDPAVIVGLLGLSLVNYAARGLRWQVFSRCLGVNVAWWRAAVYFVAGFALTVTPGKLGEALRLWLLRRGHGFRYERTAALLIADRLSDSGALLLLCLLGMAGFAARGWVMAPVAVAVLGATAVLLWPAALLGLTGWVFARVKRWPRVFARVRTALRQIGRLASWSVYGGSLGLALLGWFAEVLAFHWLLSELGAAVDLGQSAFIFAIAMLAGAAVMLPGGLGGTELGMVGLLVAAGVGLDVAIAATGVIRLTTLWFAVTLGFLALPAALRLVGAAPAAARAA